MALSIEEAFGKAAENLHALGMEAFGDECCYVADLADLRAYGHAVLARASYGHGWEDDAPAHNECPECYRFHEIEEEIDNLRKEASKLDRGGTSI